MTILDQQIDTSAATDRTLYFKDPLSGNGIHDFVPADDANANIVSSLLPSGKHAPVLDLDIPHTLIPSSTPGHSHLYLDVEMSWWKYRVLLWALRFTNIIEPGYYQMATFRRQTLVRRPGVIKQNDNWGRSGLEDPGSRDRRPLFAMLINRWLRLRWNQAHAASNS